MTDYDFVARGSLDEVAQHRSARLKSLSELPELFEELTVQRSAVYAIRQEEVGVIGYLTSLDDTLTELYVVPRHRTHVDHVLLAARDTLGLKHAWASTFDPLAMAACVSVRRTFKVLGIHFRGFHEVELPTPSPAPIPRIATASDTDLVAEANHPDVFDDPTEIPVWVNNGWVTLFELSGELAGIGLCTPTGPETPACDIGLLVCPPHQGRGLGPWIAQQMVRRALSQGLRPTAGCAADNRASRRTLERAGFVADHRLLEFKL